MQKNENKHSCVNVLADEYLEQLRARRYSTRSVEIYGRALRDFMKSMTPHDDRAVTAKDLERYRAILLARGFKAGSIAVYFQALKLFFRYLEERQIIFANPAAGLQPMRLPVLLQPVPTEEEMQILLSQPDTATPVGVRDLALLETLYSSGVRRSELLSMTVGSLSLDEGRVRVMGKGSRERIAPLGVEAVRALKQYLQEARPALVGPQSGEALWLASNGMPLSGVAAQQMLRHYSKVPGITAKIGLHSIRRACATHMLRRGASPAVLQLLLGHADLRHLSQYLKVTITDLKQVHAQSRVGQ